MSNELTNKSFDTPQARSVWHSFSNKEVPFHFMGTSFSFALSQSLFSSVHIDNGSQLLLKSIALHLPLSDIHSVLDAGCGVGVLGICARQSAAPDCRLQLEDRDALALLFAYHNALRNHLSPADFQVRHRLLLEGDEGSRYDLILSNIPAKAGAPVIRAFLKNAPDFLTDTETSRIAVVVVKPLAQEVLQTLRRFAYPILFREETAEYLVLHFKKALPPVPPGQKAPTVDLSHYFRSVTDFSLPLFSYSLQTVFHLPNFDRAHASFSQQTELLSFLLSNPKRRPLPAGRPLSVGVLHPGQGHLPLFAALCCRREGISFRLSLISNDRLQLLISRYNLSELAPPETLTLLPHYTLPDPELPSVSPFDLFLLDPSSLSLPHERKSVCNLLPRWVAPEGYLLFSALSVHANAFQKGLPSFALVRAKKTKGFRSLLLQKK